MDFVESLKSYLNEEEISALIEAIPKKKEKGVLLHDGKISDAHFLSRYPKLKPHPVVPHAYLYDGDEVHLGKSFFYEAGAISIMDPSSMLPFFYLDPNEEDRVLDIAAAPGGKTIGMSLLMKQKGAILSNDISYDRAKRLSSNVERMGIGNIAVTSGDFSKCHKSYKGYFSKILLDAPCSGSAMFGKNEFARKDWSYKKVESLSFKQRELLEICYQMLQEGGRLMYSTCSFDNEENDLVILSFLKDHPLMKPIMIKQEEGYWRSPILPEAVHLFPHLFPGEGQYLCLLEKQGDMEASNRDRQRKKISDPLFAKLGLEDRDNIVKDGVYYSLSSPLKIEGIPLLRYGVKCGESKNGFTPSLHLARFKDTEGAIELNLEETIHCIRGEPIYKNTQLGYQLVYFDGLNVSYMKQSGGILKNHYPKGLRKNLSIEDFGKL